MGIQDFQLGFSYPHRTMLAEPLILVAAFFLLYLLAIIYVRLDFSITLDEGVSSVKNFKTLLPAAAKDVYYRDDIGNISTSHMKVMDDAVELDLRPRFPLFGGWRSESSFLKELPT